MKYFVTSLIIILSNNLSFGQYLIPIPTSISTTEVIPSPTNNTSGGIVSGDFDNDGDEDISRVVSGINYVSKNLGNGTFSSPVAQGSAPTNTVMGVAIDLNQDGNLDIVGIERNTLMGYYQLFNFIEEMLFLSKLSVSAVMPSPEIRT